jgi:hypothetical protein
MSYNVSMPFTNTSAKILASNLAKY